MSTYLIDTNVLIAYLEDSLDPDRSLEIDAIFRRSFVISVISEIEFLGWKGHTVEDYPAAYRFINSARIIPLSQDIIDETI
jgi:toxin FitB